MRRQHRYGAAGRKWRRGTRGGAPPQPRGIFVRARLRWVRTPVSGARSYAYGEVKRPGRCIARCHVARAPVVAARFEDTSALGCRDERQVQRVSPILWTRVAARRGALTMVISPFGMGKSQSISSVSWSWIQGQIVAQGSNNDELVAGQRPVTAAGRIAVPLTAT